MCASLQLVCKTALDEQRSVKATQSVSIKMCFKRSYIYIYPGFHFCTFSFSSKSVSLMKLNSLLLADNVFIEYLDLSTRTVTAVHIFPM